MRPAGCFNHPAAVDALRQAGAARGRGPAQGKATLLFTIEKGRDGGGNKVRVTFSAPPIEGCRALYLVGWFDEWKESAFPMTRIEDGGWELTLELDRGCEYLYRFRTEDGTWLSDPSMPSGAGRFGLNTSFYLSESVGDRDTP